MGYIESNLLPDERVVYKATLHWIIYRKCFFFVFIGIALLWVKPALGGIVILIGLLFGIPAFIDYLTSELGVTTKRVIIKTGLLRRRTLELLLQQVEAIAVDQSVPGRILGYGTLTLTGTGGVREVFHNVSSPLEFRRRIQSRVS